MIPATRSERRVLSIIRLASYSTSDTRSHVREKGTTQMYSSLSLKIFYPDSVSESELDDYNNAFSFWYRIWIEMRDEVDDRSVRWSDSFSRQSEILVLYYEDRPIATCCHRYVDLRQRALIHDSYFSSAIWPESAREIIPELGTTCMLGSHLFIDPEFRKRRSELSIKAIVCSLCFAHVNGTRPDVLLGAVRIDRGLHKLFHDCGATSLHATAINWYERIPLDLIALFPKLAPIAIDARYQEAVRMIGATCDRFAVNYFERGAVLRRGSAAVRAAERGTSAA